MNIRKFKGGAPASRLKVISAEIRGIYYRISNPGEFYAISWTEKDGLDMTKTFSSREDAQRWLQELR